MTNVNSDAWDSISSVLVSICSKKNSNQCSVSLISVGVTLNTTDIALPTKAVIGADVVIPGIQVNSKSPSAKFQPTCNGVTEICLYAAVRSLNNTLSDFVF